MMMPVNNVEGDDDDVEDVEDGNVNFEQVHLALHTQPGVPPVCRQPGEGKSIWENNFFFWLHPQNLPSPTPLPASIPQICQFWYTTTLFRPVQSTPKSA